MTNVLFSVDLPELPKNKIMLFALICFMFEPVPENKWKTINQECMTNTYTKNKGNPFVEYVHQDYDPIIDVNEESPIELRIDPKVVKELPNDGIEEFLLENKYTDVLTAHKIQEKLKAANSLSMSFNVFKCDDIKNQFDRLPAEQKNYNTFWNKRITRDSLLVKATRNETTTTLKVKKVVAILKKRRAERSVKSVKVDTNICYLRQEARWITPEACAGFTVPAWCQGVRKVHQHYRDISKVISTVNFNEIKYQFPATVKWRKDEIETLFYSVQRQVQNDLYLF